LTPQLSESRETVADVGYKKEVLTPKLSESRETVADVGYKRDVLGPQLLKVERQLLM